MSTISSGDIEALVNLFRSTQWRELHLQGDGVDLFLSKDSDARPPHLAPAALQSLAQPALDETASAVSVPSTPADQAASSSLAVPGNCTIVRASSLGTFYRAPKPGAPPFCNVGQAVEEDSQLCLIEVMKLFTTVRAGINGTIREICVNDGEMVEFDQPLFVIEKNA